MPTARQSFLFRVYPATFASVAARKGGIAELDTGCGPALVRAAKGHTSNEEIQQ